MQAGYGAGGVGTGAPNAIYTLVDPLDMVACTESYKIYFAALYWAVKTITSIGYGDIAATPLNTLEQVRAHLPRSPTISHDLPTHSRLLPPSLTTLTQVVATALMLAGSFLWAKVRISHDRLLSPSLTFSRRLSPPSHHLPLSPSFLSPPSHSCRQRSSLSLSRPPTAIQRSANSIVSSTSSTVS